MQADESEYVLFFCKILEVYTVGIVLTEVDLMSLSHARSVIDELRNNYNLQRRLTSLKGLPPCEFPGLAKNHGVKYSNYGLHINWGQPHQASIFVDLITSVRGGPQWLDSFGADLRWKPPSIMPPSLSDILLLAGSSMSHTAFCRQGKNVAALHCNA